MTVEHCPKQYNGLDVLKFCAALAVVSIHCTSYHYTFFRQYFVDSLFTIAVPFFFVCSGFFFSRIINSGNKDRFITYIKKLLLMYLFWSIIGLPSMLYNLYMSFPGQYSFWILMLIRSFFLTGSSGVFWYLLAMIIASVVMYHFLSKKQNALLLFISCTGFIIGLIWEYCGDSNPIFIFFNYIWGNSKNFFMQGLPFMCLGYYLSKSKRVFSKRFLYCALFFSIILKQIEYNFFVRNGLAQIIICIFLLEIGTQVTFPIGEKKAILLRELSSCIYFIHFLVILPFDFYLHRPWYIDYSVTLMICVVTYFIIKAANSSFLNTVFNISSRKDSIEQERT